MNNKTIFNVLKGQERLSEFDADQKTTRATWDAANQDLYSVLFFTTAGSAFFVVRRFQGKTSAGGAGHGQQAWTALHEKSTDVRGPLFGQSTSGWQARGCDPTKTPTTICTTWIAAGTVSMRAIHRKAPHGLAKRGHRPPSRSLEVRPYSQPHFNMRDFGLADIRCMMVVYDGGYLRRQLVPFRTIKRHRGTRRRNAGGGPGPHNLCPMLLLRSTRAFQKKVPTPNQTPSAAVAATSSTSSAANIKSTSARVARTAAKQRWRAGTSFSSKDHQICFPRPRGSRRNKISSHRGKFSATTRSTTTTPRTMICGGTCRTTPPLWISASIRLPER